jgi:hypothetical protein
MIQIWWCLKQTTLSSKIPASGAILFTHQSHTSLSPEEHVFNQLPTWQAVCPGTHCLLLGTEQQLKNPLAFWMKGTSSLLVLKCLHRWAIDGAGLLPRSMKGTREHFSRIMSLHTSSCLSWEQNGMQNHSQ